MFKFFQDIYPLLCQSRKISKTQSQTKTLVLEDYLWAIKPLTRLYSVVDQKWFLVQHLPQLILTEPINPTGHYLTHSVLERCFWLSSENELTPNSSGSYGLKGYGTFNIPITADQIGKDFLTEAQVLSQHREAQLNQLFT